MNWPSYHEDIEEMRHQNMHFQTGIDDLIQALRKEPTLETIHRAEASYRKLSEQLIKKYETHRSRIAEQFKEAVRFLKDPRVQITAKLDKRTKERDEARSELADCRTQLKACRESQARNLARITSLGKEKATLEQELQGLKDSAYVRSALKGVQPLRRK